MDHERYLMTDFNQQSQSHILSGLETIPQSAMSTSSTGLSCTVAVSSMALKERLWGGIDVIKVY